MLSHWIKMNFKSIFYDLISTTMLKKSLIFTTYVKSDRNCISFFSCLRCHKIISPKVQNMAEAKQFPSYLWGNFVHDKD